MARPTSEERRVFEFLLNNAREREAALVNKRDRINEELGRVRDTIRDFEEKLDR